MPGTRTHSRPPSWSTLFPPSHDHSQSLLEPPPEWQLPQYSPAPKDGETPAQWHSTFPKRPASPVLKASERFWVRYGRWLAVGLAVTTLSSTMFATALLIKRPTVWRTEVVVVDPLADLIGETLSSPYPDMDSSGADVADIPTSEPEVKPASQAVDYREYIGQFVRGPPTESFEDNLLPEYKYITSWPSAGWTNDVMTYANLIHLALLTQRIPILPPFAPSHLSLSAGFPPVCEVFDIPRLSKELGIPILEWRDVKDEASEAWDVLGCWSTWSTWHESERPSIVLSELKLDVSYTGVPDSFKLFPQDVRDPHVSLNKIMQLAFPSVRKSALQKHHPAPARLSGLSLEPSEHLLCYDYLYYTSVDTYYEWWQDWSPQWRLVGTHMHWRERVDRIAKEYLMRHFGTEDVDSLPPFIVIHARRGDFLGQCETANVDCLPTLAQMKTKVEQMQIALAEKGIVTDHVLVTSDETDPGWWAAIVELGWTHIDHTAFRTEARFGKWYGPILDAAFHSMGAAVIGTERSTMSLLGERRAHDWQDAPTTRLMLMEP